MAEETANHPVDEATPPRRRRSGGVFQLVKAVAFVSVIVVVEVVVASMLAPSAEDTARLAEQLSAASAGELLVDHDDSTSGREKSGKETLREVELGLFNVTRYNPVTNTTLAIDFELFGTVLASDLSNFQQRYERSKARAREQITMTLHGANSADLTDAGLGLIKRQILEKTNRTIGEPLLKEVLFSKFNFVER